MSIGSLSAHAGLKHARFLQKLLSLTLAFALAVSMVPSVAWAEAENNSGALVADESQAVEPSPEAGDADAIAGANQKPDAETPAEIPAGHPAELPTDMPSIDSTTLGDMSDDDVLTSEVPKQGTVDVAPSSASEKAIADDAAQSEATALSEERAAQSLTSKCFASITTSPNSWSSQAPSGFVWPPTTLYASAWKSSSSRVNDDAAWTYNWYAVSENRSPSSLSTGDLIEGQHGSSLRLTNELATELEGTYLLVQITSADGVTVSGPRQANRPTGKLYGVGSIQAPVPTKTALDEKSYVLIQDAADTTSSYNTVDAAALRAGQSLFANAYDSEVSPNARIAAQDCWTYQWLAGDSRDADDSAYEVIAGQTGSSLTITEDLAMQLAGKYIRVKVSGDGQELYGPSGSFDRPGSTHRNTPGPVVAAGQIVVSHIILAYNNVDFGDDVESVPNANVGDTIRAAAYDKDDPSTLYRGDEVEFSWQVADSADDLFKEVATGDEFTITNDSYVGKYLKVVATAKSSVPGLGRHETEIGRILAKGVVTLSRVAILNTDKAAMDTGSTLEAMAYAGDYWSEATVTEGVVYTWRWSDKDPSSSEFDADTDWQVVEGVTGDSLTVPNSFVGCWVSVSADAGDNVVFANDSSAAGPFKKPGTIELYYTALNKVAGDDTFVYKAGEAIGVTACAVSSAGTAGEYLTDDQLTFTWKVSDRRNGEYVELADENVHKPSFVIPASYVGTYLECEVSAGFNVEIAGPMQNAIAEAPEQTAVVYTLSSVDLISSGQLMQVGDTVTPLPQHMVGEGEWAYEAALPADAVVTYTWYAADDAADTHLRTLTGADAATGALALTEDMQGAYLYVVANAGDNDVRSQPFLVESAVPQEMTVNVEVVGTTRHQVGEEFSAEAWIPLTEYTWSSNEKTTAWDAFAKLLTKAGYFYDLTGGTPYSITTPDKAYTLAMSESAPWSYWSFFVNGQYASALASGYTLKDGDTIELRYIDAASTEKPSGDVVVNPDADHPDLAVDWAGFGNGGTGSVVEDVATPTEKTEAAWTNSLLTDEERAKGAFASASEPLIIGGKLYVVSGSISYDPITYASVSSLARVSVIDPATGAVEKQQELATSMDSVCRPVYEDGIIVIPLSSGYLQAVSAATLETLWVVAGIAGAQSLSSLSVSGGYVYVSTADSLDGSYCATSGTIRRINLHTGALAGSVANESTGYYWAGGVVLGGYFLVPDDSGQITSYSSDLSNVLDSVQVSGESLRSSLVVDESFVYAVSTEGALYKLTVDTDGTLNIAGSASFAAYSTSMPTICNGKAFVGGSLSNYKGVLAVIDLNTMEVTQIAKASGVELLAEVKSAPLVSVQNGQMYVYFTCNGATLSRSTFSSGGGVYVYRVGDAEASVLYDPVGDLANYCMASMASGPDGTLYYTNDSGHLFALKAKTSGDPNDNGGASGGDGQNGNDNSGDRDDSNKGGSGHVPASKMPLTAQTAKDVSVKEAPKATDDKVAVSAKEAEARKGTAALHASAADGGADATASRDSVNPWAVGGIALGVVGLVCVVGYVVRTRRKNGDAS